RVLFLVASAIGIFCMRELWMVASAAGVLAVLWIIVGLGLRRLFRQVVKLWGFALLLAISCLVVVDESARLGFTIGFDAASIEEGGVLFLRVLAVIVASQVARA